MIRCVKLWNNYISFNQEGDSASVAVLLQRLSYLCQLITNESISTLNNNGEAFKSAGG